MAEDYSRVSQGLRWAVLHNAIALPLAFTTNTGSVRGGILTENGGKAPVYVQELRGRGKRGEGNTVTSRTKYTHGDASSEWGTPDSVERHQTALYLGPMWKHFGHFVTESVARGWAYEFDGIDYDVAFFLPETANVEERMELQKEGLTGYRKHVLEFLGIDNVEMVVNPTRFDRILAPQKGAVLFTDRHEDYYLDWLAQRARTKFGAPRNERKIFYARPGDYTGTFGEKYIADFLVRFGYEKVSPEALSIDEQLELAWNTKVAVGVQGSAFHIFNLLGRADATLVVLRRQRPRIHDGFMDSVAPYVSKASTITEITKVYPKDHMSMNLPDVSRLLDELSVVDKEFDRSAFDWEEFYRSIAMEVVAKFSA